jgi:ABC-type proline/glycine betaine transport system ATPase subunit
VVNVTIPSLTVPAGDICVLVGPSGGGKTTALKLVNRLLEPDSGDVMVEGSDLGIALQSPSFCPIEQTIIPLVGQ